MVYCVLYFPEDAYRIDAEVDGEVVGLDILDTAGQVRLSLYTSFRSHIYMDNEDSL